MKRERLIPSDMFSKVFCRERLPDLCYDDIMFLWSATAAPALAVLEDCDRLVIWAAGQVPISFNRRD